ncbi:MAG TPA: helix-turn-helix transcriptional regulator [Pseudonocardiaceae bacterium]|nr:helix-turn-helix transcriptional regulator [Pseudonocardiaceae bacterium]
MIDGRSTVRSRELGNALRLAMERSNFSGKRLAELLGWSESRISRFLTGRLGATEVEVSAMLALLGVIGDQRDQLLQLTREQGQRGWSRSEQARALAEHQRKAVRIADFHAAFVPFLLQTENYARSVVSRMVNVPFDSIEQQVSERMADQVVFTRGQPPYCVFYIHELALHLPIGGYEVMSEQLHHLLRMAVRSYVNIRVIPAAAGAHAGLAGSCCLMEFADFDPVVYLDEEIAGHFMEEPDEIAAYQKVFAALSAIALDKTTSKDIIAALASDHYDVRKEAEALDEDDE